MVNRKQELRLLVGARDAHKARLGHVSVVVGLNFVECETCKAHAHIEGESLRAHDRTYGYHQLITAKQF